jgi:hypothetical protein
MVMRSPARPVGFPRPVGPQECSHGRKAVVYGTRKAQPRSGVRYRGISFAPTGLTVLPKSHHGLAAVATFFRPYGPVLVVMLLALSTQSLMAQTQVKVFGSTSTETTVTSANPDSPLNPGNVLDIEKSTNSSDITTYGNIAPESRSWKVNFKLRGTANLQRNSTARGEISEFFFSKSVTSWLDIGAGRRIERWGTGYGWNPTGVVNPPKDAADPNDRRDAYRGTDMVKADILAKGWNFSLIGAPQIQWKSGKNIQSVGWAARAYRLVSGVDLSISASGGNGLPNSFGVSGARVIGNALEVHAEFARISDSKRIVPVNGELQLVPRAHSALVAGGHYTFRNGMNLMVEYHHTGLGLRRNEWNEFREIAADASKLADSNRYFVPFGMSRNYSLVRFHWPVIQNKLDIETMAITSLRDGSSLVRPAVNWKIRPNVEVYWLHNAFTGRSTTELGHTQVRGSSHFGIRYHFSFDRSSKP